MTESDDRRAEQIDQAIEQLRSGAAQPACSGPLDPDLAPLVQLAARLARELPPNLPDPAFREQLGHDLAPLSQTNLRGRRFFYDWRFAVAAAALVGIILIVVIYGLGTFLGADKMPPARETVVSALSVGDKGTEEAGTIGTPRTVSDTAVFPPIDQEHVVQGPLGLSSGPTPVASPEPEPTPGIALATTLPALPETAPTWLLTGPESSQTFLETLMARVGISGQIEPAGDDGPNAFVVVDPSGFEAIHWNQHDAYFRYDRGPNEPTPPPIRATTTPETTAKDWLSEIGFDLVSISYRTSTQSIANQTLVHFTPDNLPAVALQPGLGVTVGVGPDGAIQFAQGFWLTLGESADVHLRSSQEMFDAANAGEWYAPRPAARDETLHLKVGDAELAYLLTRADDSSYLLQPVLELSGDRWTTHGPVPDTIYISAILKK